MATVASSKCLFFPCNSFVAVFFCRFIHILSSVVIVTGVTWHWMCHMIRYRFSKLSSSDDMEVKLCDVPLETNKLCATHIWTFGRGAVGQTAAKSVNQPQKSLGAAGIEVRQTKCQQLSRICSRCNMVWMTEGDFVAFQTLRCSQFKAE